MGRECDLLPLFSEGCSLPAARFCVHGSGVAKRAEREMGKVPAREGPRGAFGDRRTGRGYCEVKHLCVTLQSHCPWRGFKSWPFSHREVLLP